MSDLTEKTNRELMAIAYGPIVGWDSIINGAEALGELLRRTQDDTEIHKQQTQEPNGGAEQIA